MNSDNLLGKSTSIISIGSSLVKKSVKVVKYYNIENCLYIKRFSVIQKILVSTLFSTSFYSIFRLVPLQKQYLSPHQRLL